MTDPVLTQEGFLERWRAPSGPRAVAAGLAIALLLAGSGVLIYHTGGTSAVWPHLMYVPIILAAGMFRVAGAVLAGLAAGLILGPFMPLDTAAGISQSLANWTIRLGFFLVTAVLAGLLSRWLNRELDRVRYESLHDERTGLPNLLSLEHALTSALHRPDGERQPVTVAMITISNFLEIVNTLGYRATQEISRKVAERLRTADVPHLSIYAIARDRFALTAGNVELHDFVGYCRRIFEHLQRPFDIEGVPVTVNMHIGIAQSTPGQASADETVQKASVAARVAAERGALYHTYSQRYDKRSVERLTLLGSLNGAIKRGELQLYYQPKISIATRRVSGVEGLLRWQHSTNGLLGPERFIAEAEQTWLVHPVSLFVAKAAMRKLKQWASSGIGLKLAINFTARNIQDASFVEEFLGLLEEYDIDPASLEIELTERTVMTEPEKATEVLYRFKARGIGVGIDDFGTGYTTIGSLRKLPLDTLKIDQSFIHTLETSQVSCSVVKGIIGVARELSYTTVAEGVDNERTLALLGELGCNMAQGYHIAQPLSEAEFDAWLRTSPWGLSQEAQAGERPPS